MKRLKRKRYWIFYTLILILAGFLNFYGVWKEGYGNEFYAACIKSMLQSAKNFFFVSFDPGGWVTVDKPPVALWIQALFAAVLGFKGWVLILPEALASVGSVALLNRMVGRRFGKTAGLLSALLLALSPVFVAVSRTNNLDAILIFFMLFAAQEILKAADTGRLRPLLLGAVLLGVAYNTKTLQAFLILPALWTCYLFATDLPLRKRVGQLLLATLVLATVSLSWSVIVDLTPADERPYVDSSSTNSELELAFGYNGIKRVVGNSPAGGGQDSGRKTGGAPFNTSDDTEAGTNREMPAPGGTPDDAANEAPEGDNKTSNGDSIPDFPGDGQMSESGYKHSSFGGAQSGDVGGKAPTQTGFSGFGGGKKGIFRMFSESLGGQDSWLLPFALMGILALGLAARKKAGVDRETRLKLLRAALFWGGSVLTICAYFSVAGFFHQYYIATLAPFLAGLAGIGFVEMRGLYREKGIQGLLLPLAMALTIAAQLVMLAYYPDWSGVLIPLVLVLAGVPTTLLFFKKRMARRSTRVQKAVLAIGFAGLLLVPAIWSCTPLLYGDNASIPYAGPELASARMGGGKASGSSDGSENDKLIDFLQENNSGEKFLVAVPDSQSAESIILETGKPVLSVGGFTGEDKTLTVEKLKEMVQAGEIRYFLVGGRGGASSSELISWVKANGREVSKDLWSETASTAGSSNDKADTESGSSENSLETVPRADSSGTGAPSDGGAREMGSGEQLYDLSVLKED